MVGLVEQGLRMLVVFLVFVSVAFILEERDRVLSAGAKAPQAATACAGFLTA